jgi:SOS response regulatory protein OraA/RecX
MTGVNSRDLLTDLRAVGIEVADIWDLVNTSGRYDAALPVLLDWLTRLNDRMAPGPERDTMREALVRALTVKAARPMAAAEMIRQFRSPDADPGRLRWTLGNGLSIVADDSVIEDIIDLFTDRRWGSDRQMLAGVLGRSRDPRAGQALVSQLDDDDVNGQAVGSLGKLKSPPSGARAAVQRLTTDQRAFVRRAATATLAKLPG